MGAIKASWTGQERLWKVFWLYDWLLGAALGIGAEVASRVFGTPGEIITSLVILVWGVWVTVSLWRCAFNASWQGWGYIVRTVLIFGLAALVFIIIDALQGESVA